MSAASAKILLNKSNQKRYREFTLNSDESISLTQLSSVPWVGASQRRDIYKKTQSNETNKHVKFITKNDHPHSFLWQTSPEQLKKGVRWGIIKTHSITGKVISTLGKYRVTAHERAAKGMVSNSQAVKLKLLDLFQDRFEALEAVESMVSKNNNSEDYQVILGQYIEKLRTIDSKLNEYFSDVNLSGLDDTSIDQIRADIHSDIDRAVSFLDSVRNESSLRSYNHLVAIIQFLNLSNNK